MKQRMKMCMTPGKDDDAHCKVMGERCMDVRIVNVRIVNASFMKKLTYLCSLSFIPWIFQVCSGGSLGIHGRHGQGRCTLSHLFIPCTLDSGGYERENYQ